jgi:hypothetical protein
MAETNIGAPAVCDLTRSEDDTDDIIFEFKDKAGALIDTTSWTGTLSVGDDNDNLAAGTFQKTYTGTGSGADGRLSIDMNLFDVPKGSFKYDLRVVDASVGDSPSRVYVKGSLKVTPRIN